VIAQILIANSTIWIHHIFVLQLHNAYWLVDKATASQICDLAHVIDAFTEDCEKVSGKTSTALRAAFRVQVCEISVHSYLFYIENYCFKKDITCQILCFVVHASRYIHIKNNQLDAQFIFSIFRQTSRCFGRNYSPSSGGCLLSWFGFQPNQDSKQSSKKNNKYQLL